MFSRVIAKNIGDVFLRHSVYRVTTRRDDCIHVLWVSQHVSAMRVVLFIRCTDLFRLHASTEHTLLGWEWGQNHSTHICYFCW